MTATREALMARLKAAKREVAMPGPWVSQRRYADLVGQFELALTAAHGEVMRAADFEGALEKVGVVLEEVQAKAVAVNPQSPLDGVAWSARLPGYDWHVVGRDGRDTRQFCIDADVGVTMGMVGLAETGSVAVQSGGDASRYVPLLPPVHIALLPESRLTSDLFTWSAGRGDGFQLPASWVFISGPSKTADIEQTLSIGVHGPKRFVAIVYR